MILNPCVRQISKYSFIVQDVQTEENYVSAGIDLTAVTAAKITFKNLFTNLSYDIDIFSRWAYLLGDGVTINITDFPNFQMGIYDHFPDWSYSISVVYVLGGVTYSNTRITGFRDTISNIVYQQLQQSDWVKELRCNCGTDKYSTSLRKFNYLDGLRIASKNCLTTQYNEIVLALYKLTGTVHEYA